jgi:hypothetical protein
MPTLTQARPKNVPIIPAVEEAEYPPELFEKWDRLYETAQKKIATGELVPQTAKELAVEFGINLDD